jgi:hypothetical protein
MDNEPELQVREEMKRKLAIFNDDNQDKVSESSTKSWKEAAPRKNESVPSDKPETVYHLTPCAMPQRKLTSIKVPNTGLSKRVLLAFSKPPKTSTLTCE